MPAAATALYVIMNGHYFIVSGAQPIRVQWDSRLLRVYRGGWRPDSIGGKSLDSSGIWLALNLTGSFV